ncbi:MAG: hypothetical protein ACREFU_05450 [Acetobacteraceae bacterium]
MLRAASIALAALASLASVPAAAGPLPSIPGSCTRSAITWLGQRLTDGANGPPIAGSGSAVGFANGGYQVSYDEIPAINEARRNDPVVICLVRLPKNCPPGDARGRVYATVDLRSLRLWVLPDSEHSCGGA